MGSLALVPVDQPLGVCSLDHPFEKILWVSGDGWVVILNESSNLPLCLSCTDVVCPGGDANNVSHYCLM